MVREALPCCPQTFSRISFTTRAQGKQLSEDLGRSHFLWGLWWCGEGADDILVHFLMNLVTK